MSYDNFDIIVILLLILANGLFSMSEIAIISSRKSRLQEWAEDGDAKARAALDLANSPNQLLSTVQIGITLVGVLCGAFGGATIAGRFASVLNRIPALGPYSDTLALGAVVLCITFLSLVIGELVPKRLALNNPERIASIAANPMRYLSVIASPAVKLLSVSTDLVLRLLGMRPSSEPPVTENEIRVLIEQGTTAGIFEEAEQEMVERIFRLGDRMAGVLMTPRKKIDWLDVSEPIEKTRRKIAGSTYSRFPVCQGRFANVLGVVHVRDLLDRSLAGLPFNLKASMQEPLFVHENTQVIKVMELFKTSGMQMALVIDEYGTIEGLITLNDILEAIIGDFPSENEHEEPRVVQREDGSWLVDGMLPVDELKELFDIKKLPEEQSAHYQTLGGFMMTCLKRIPLTGDNFEYSGLRFEVVDMDGHRVDKVLIQPLLQKAPPSEYEAP
ncbi:MAG: hemolysin family protein [Syntrophobacteraceae bacterium]